MAASLLLCVSAGLSLTGSASLESNGTAALLQHGWQKTDRIPCPEVAVGKFYELEGAAEVVESYILAPGQALVANLPLPDPILGCREIGQPHFIQEIR